MEPIGLSFGHIAQKPGVVRPRVDLQRHRSVTDRVRTRESERLYTNLAEQGLVVKFGVRNLCSGLDREDGGLRVAERLVSG